MTDSERLQIGASLSAFEVDRAGPSFALTLIKQQNEKQVPP